MVQYITAQIRLLAYIHIAAINSFVQAAEVDHPSAMEQLQILIQWLFNSDSIAANSYSPTYLPCAG